MANQTIDVRTSAIGRQTLTVDATAGGVGFTAANFSRVSTGTGANSGATLDARCALITVDGDVETNDIRWTCDGTAPVAATTGHLLQAGDVLTLYGYGNILKFRAIREGGTNGTLQVTFFV